MYFPFYGTIVVRYSYFKTENTQVSLFYSYSALVIFHMFKNTVFETNSSSEAWRDGVFHTWAVILNLNWEVYNGCQSW